MRDVLIKLQRKGQMVIPRSLREAAGVSEGTLMKVSVIEGPRFLLTPQVTVDRAVLTAPATDRRQLFRELAQVVGEIRQEAREKGLDTVSAKEINRAVAAARRNKRGTNRRSAK